MKCNVRVNLAARMFSREKHARYYAARVTSSALIDPQLIDREPSRFEANCRQRMRPRAIGEWERKEGKEKKEQRVCVKCACSKNVVYKAGIENELISTSSIFAVDTGRDLAIITFPFADKQRSSIFPSTVSKSELVEIIRDFNLLFY